jgi:hypothetical protein
MATRWGDDSKETVESKDTVFSSKPDKSGVKTVVEHKRNAAGNRVKITRKVKVGVLKRCSRVSPLVRARALNVCFRVCGCQSQVTTKMVRVNKHVQARRKWAKFGDCAGKPPGECAKRIAPGAPLTGRVRRCSGPEPIITAVSQFEFIDLSDLRPKRRDDEGKESQSVIFFVEFCFCG